ncbi:MAG: hypothetical protein ACPLW9_01870 [Minisyncoccales bacterium]
MSENLEKPFIPSDSDSSFKIGQEVKIKRSSGKIEEGWKIVYGAKLPGHVVVCKEEINPVSGEEKILQKEVSLEQLKEWNKETNLEEEYERAINQARNFQELVGVIMQRGDILGPNGHLYKKEELIKRLMAVIGDNMPIQFVSRLWAAA